MSESPTHRHAGRHAGVLVALAASAALGGCGGNAYAPPPPPEVTVAQPVEREVTTYLDLTGQTRAVESVEIRARVKGVLESMSFTPGSNVTQGDLLFVIEPDLYQARVDQAQADLDSTQARLQAAEEQFAIAQAVFQQKAGSKTDMVQKQQARDEARAAIEQAKATLAVAQLDLSYTHIYAPIGGRIDRNFVDVGNLVGAEEPTLLASIVRQHPIYAYFQVSERDALVYRALSGHGEAGNENSERAPAYMALATDQGFPHAGLIDYASNKIDPSTGTFEARAVFSNADGTILPGLFVRLHLPVSRGAGLLVPDDALGIDQGGRYALVVGEDGTVQHRPVEVGALSDGMRMVQKGLTAEDWVVVNGVQRARPGTKVTPKRTELPPADTAAAAPANGQPTEANAK